MKDTFYKDDFKVYIFTDDDLDNETLIASVEASPTHKRLAKDLQQIKNNSMAAKVEPAAVATSDNNDNNPEII